MYVSGCPLWRGTKKTVSKIRLLIADDVALHRELLGKLLDRQGDMEVVGEASSPEEAVEQAALLTPDVVLMDLRMPRSDPRGGIRATQIILAAQPQVKVLVLTESDDEADVRAAALAGAVGYVVKSVKSAQIAGAVRAAYAGKGWLDPNVTGYLLQDYRRASQQEPAISSLTPTELKVLRLVATGRTTAEVGEQLFVAEKTVKNHLANVYRKLAVRNRSHAVSEAYRRGWLK